MSTTIITAAVTRLYEAFPYPRYPLLAKPRWQEGYLTSSAFAARLAGTSPDYGPRGQADILIGGAGEILPYIIRKWEPFRHRVTCLDLSRTSLRRARLRLFPIVRPTAFVQADLAQFLAQSPQRFAHIDAYGVLHHMPEPRAALHALAGALRPGGTARLMVYNSRARAWIRELQRAFALLQVDAYWPLDLNAVRSLLDAARREMPALDTRLSHMGATTLRNDARLVDTFLHAREARLSISDWLNAVTSSGLTLHGLFDRYAELDDLPNPLWRAPQAAELIERANDGRFENNLELFLAKPPLQRPTTPSAQAPLRFFLKAPPRAWFNYPETRDVSLSLRIRLWHAHVRWVQGGIPLGNAAWLNLLTAAARGRLARLGAILPGMIGVPALELGLIAPLTKRVEAPQLPAPARVSPDGALARLVHARLAAIGKDDLWRREAILTRFTRAQF